MKTGYSILLGEYIEAAHIDYADCKGFQIVCPNCKEPIFKVEREGELALHYLSHYAAAKAFATDCELRVSGLDSLKLEQHNHASREQRLKLFLGVLRRVVTDQFYSTGKEKVPSMQRLLNRSKAVTWMREAVFSAMRSHRDAFLNDFEKYAETYIGEGVGDNDPVWKTGFAMSVQVRIAKDMMASLMTGAGRENFYWLWNHAYAFLETRLEGGRRIGIQTPPIAAIESHLARLPYCSKAEGMARIAEMANTPMYPPEVEEPGFKMLLKVFAEIQHEMVGCLIRLPYFEMLREAGHV